MTRRFEHAGMFDRAGDDRSRCRLSQPEQGEVVCLSSAARENDLIWFRIQQAANAFASIFERLASLATEAVTARRVPGPLAQPGPHGFQDFRYHRRRGTIVEINVHASVARM